MRYFCSQCKETISEEVYQFSVDHFSRALCREHQKENNPKTYTAKRSSKNKPEPTPEAITLYNILKKLGYNAKLEKWDGHKHIDIAIPDLKINIEVDGMQHSYDKNQALADLKRTSYSFKKGYMTFRIPNKLIQEDAYATGKYLKKILESSKEQLEEELEGDEDDNFNLF